MTSTVRGPAARATSRLLIGRQEALARLDRALAEALAAERAGTVLVEGPAGIGKSRIVEEFRTLAQEQGGEVLVGRCVSLGEEIFPYAPVAELLRDLVARSGADAVRAWAGPAAPELARLVPALAPADDAPEATAGSVGRLFQACCSLFDSISGDRPLVLVVEDVHWADQSTRELLSLLAHQLRGGTLILLTLRTDEAPRDLGVVRLTAELARRGDDHVVLQPLTREEQARQISDILGVPPPRSLLDQVYARAEGNPFFAEELLALNRAGELPPTVRDLLLARLDALAPATRQVLRTGAVIGRTIPHDLLEAVADVSGPRLESALRSAVEEHVLVTAADIAGYQFRHALLQESIAESLLPGEATRMHRRVAEALEADPELAGDTSFAAGRVARHWYAAGDGARALKASVEAAREAKTALAFSESLAHFERALVLLETVPDGDALLPGPRYQLLRRAAEVAHLSASPGRASELVRMAIDAVDPADRISHAYLYERLGRYLWMDADGRGAIAAYEKAVSLLPEGGGPTRWRAAVLSGYSQILMLIGRYQESVPYAREAIEVAGKALGARSIEGHARNNLGVCLARLGQLDDGVAELTRARQIAEEEQDDADDVARALVNLAGIYRNAGMMAEAAEVAREGIVVSERLGIERRKGVWCRCDAAQALIALGDYGQARQLLEGAAALVPLGVDALRTDFLTGHLMIRLGDFGAATEYLERARANGAHLLDDQLVAPLSQGLVEVLTWRGELDAARQAALAAAGRLPADVDPAYGFSMFAAAVTVEAEQALAARTRERPRGAFDAWLSRFAASRAAHADVGTYDEAHEAAARCEVARAAGEDTGADWLRVADAWDGAPEPYRAAYARIRGAEALLREGDRDLAASVLTDAHATADRIGAAHLATLSTDVARRGRLRSPAPDAAEPDNPFRLTPREREVLALVAEGLSDREIGTRLFISHRTVERHVSSLLAKLDAARRTELSALAHRLDLVAPPTAG
jgi:DNA-binding CsgD family transcriptional regulator/Tfp pilus assembly protein PilF